MRVTDPSRTVSRACHGISAAASYWENELKCHPDRDFADRIIDFVRNGARIGVESEVSNKVLPNWPSAVKYKEGVYSYIEKHKASGAIQGPLEIANIDFRGSPLGAFEKVVNGKLRVIHDLSWPPGEAVNDSIPKDSYTVQYSTVHDAVKLASKYPDIWFAKADLADAYLTCPVRFEDRHYLGFSWPNSQGIDESYWFSSLPLGLRSSARLFSDYTEALNFIAKKNGASDNTIFYLDDVLTI